MKFNTLLLAGMLGFFTSCNGQGSVPVANKTHKAIGDTVSVPDKNILSVFQDKDRNFWFGSNENGLYRYDGKTLVHFTKEDGLGNNQVRRIQEDASGNIYFTTGEGISKFDGQSLITLTPVTNSFNNPWNSLPGDLWFQGDDGPFRYDGKILHSLKFPVQKDEADFELQHPDVNFSPYDVYSVYKDSKGDIWFGTSNFGVCHYDISAAKSGRDPLIWIAEEGLSESPVRSIAEDKNGVFWFGNSGQALYRYDGKNLTDIRKEKGIGNLEGESGDKPISYMTILEDDKGELWITTYEHGVWKYDGKNLTHYLPKNGITNLEIFSMYKDRDGRLWLGTRNGVYKFNGSTFEKFTF